MSKFDKVVLLRSLCKTSVQLVYVYSLPPMPRHTVPCACVHFMNIRPLSVRSPKSSRTSPRLPRDLRRAMIVASLERSKVSNLSASSGFLAIEHPTRSIVLILRVSMSYPRFVATVADEGLSARR